MDLELQQSAVGVGYQYIFRVSASTKKTSDKTKVARFFNTAVSTKNTEKIEEKKSVTMGRKLNTSLASRSNVPMCHFSSYHRVASALKIP